MGNILAGNNLPVVEFAEKEFPAFFERMRFILYLFLILPGKSLTKKKVLIIQLFSIMVMNFFRK